ncbi:MAG: hypothetical protein UT61_C0060G0005 [Candidatus Woesebacteria bacterium GW2011_GWA1_39_8]|uniref:Uncharacterized protein n=1 Tax=Candidatus Woesebacteria bacterium GW2011_GWA1_39_8 TaxID=1618552 RepID=A0A0G0SQT6_9BACT|nr:MAG: hypothetical protein UT61_C0060G0005 [Candidatus Woesebacteria bacterium GW2011_GWA1_39_8]
MKTDRINEIFEQMEGLLSELRGLYGAENKQPTTSTASSPIRVSKSKKGVGPAKPLSDLLSQGFFSSYKTPADACKELTKRALNIDKDTMSLALMRLVRRAKMERDGAGTAKDPWKYKSK